MGKPNTTVPLKLGAQMGWGSREGPVPLTTYYPNLGREGRKAGAGCPAGRVT